MRRWTIVTAFMLLAGCAWAQEDEGAETQARAEFGERFAFGMTVSFPGTQTLQFRVKSEPLPDLGQGGPVTELELGPPLDLWVLDMDGNRVDAPGARLLTPGGPAVEAEEPGHWRVDRPELGYYELTVPPVGQPWRLWAAFHPFMLRLDTPVTVTVGDEPGAVFLHPSGEALDLPTPGDAVVGDEGDAAWAAFLPWDLFEPSKPRVEIEGKTRLKAGERLELQALTQDPDDDIERVTWHLPDGKIVAGERLSLESERAEAWTLRVEVEDALGATDSAEVEIVPPPMHEARVPGMVMVQAEDFADQGGGVVEVTDRGSNVGQMITKWHQDPQHWLEWTLPVPEDRDYVLFARYATGSQNTRRALTIDGTSPGEQFDEIAFEHTGGYGRAPDDWRAKRLGPPVTLTEGEHTLRMTNLGDGLALDYIALVPAEECEE
ncbi:MAG: PKD domain-containing protein [Armatimonadota bacterium]